MTYTITRENGVLDALAVQEAINLLLEDHPHDKASVIAHLRELRDSIEEQVKPAIEEPTEFGSVVRAGYDEHTDRVLWVRTPDGWHAETQHGYHAYFIGLHDPVVLRVGVGEPAAKSKETLSAYDEGYGNGQYTGFSQALVSAAEKVRTLRAEAITSERKSAYDVVLNLLAEMQP